MKTVLIIGADFSPSSLPPALRVRFFARHLPAFGWTPIVLSTKSDFYEQSIDPENERLLPANLEVLRTPALPARLTRRFGIGDIGARSLWHHWQAIKTVVSSRRVDLLFITVPPYHSILLGRWTWNRYGIPYVIDYIDPWVTDFYNTVPRSHRPPKWWLADRFSRAVEPYAVRHVAHIVGVSQATCDGVSKRCRWLLNDMTSEIPYGAEASDFDYVKSNPRPNPVFDRDDGLIHISSVGRGGADQIPILRALFSAIRSGLDCNPAFNRMRFHFIGTSYAAGDAAKRLVLPIACEYGVDHLVSEHASRLPYLTALQLLLESDVLLAIGSVERHYTASKIFPYLLARRPILAVFHRESTVVGMLQRVSHASVFPFDSEDDCGALSQPMLASLSDIAKHGPPVAVGAEVDSTYSAYEMTRRLATAFDRIEVSRDAPRKTH